MLWLEYIAAFWSQLVWDISNSPCTKYLSIQSEKAQQRCAEEHLVATQEFNIVYTQGKYLTTYEMFKLLHYG